MLFIVIGIVVVCVQSVLGQAWATRRVLPPDDIGKLRAAHPLHVFIYVCVLLINPKCVQLVVRNVCLQSKFFFLNYSGDFKPIKTEIRVKRNVIVVGSSSMFGDISTKEKRFNKRCCCFCLILLLLLLLLLCVAVLFICCW